MRTNPDMEVVQPVGAELAKASMAMAGTLEWGAMAAAKVGREARVARPRLRRPRQQNRN